MNLHPEFVTLIEEILPLFILSLVLCLIFGIKRIKQSYKYDNLLSWIIQYTIAALMTAIFAITMILFLPLIIPETSYGIKMGIVLYCSLFGTQGLQAFFRKKLGLEVLDKEDIKKIECDRD